MEVPGKSNNELSDHTPIHLKPHHIMLLKQMAPMPFSKCQVLVGLPSVPNSVISRFQADNPLASPLCACLCPSMLLCRYLCPWFTPEDAPVLLHSPP